jgi:hypothetical protein
MENEITKEVQIFMFNILMDCWWKCKLVQPLLRFLKTKIELLGTSSLFFYTTPGYISKGM